MQPAALVETASSRKALAGFFLSGLLLAFPGAILPAWGYHVRPHYVTIGNYFLVVNLGLLLSALLTDQLRKWLTLSSMLTAGCLMAVLALVGLAFTAPPVAEWYRFFGFFGLGIGAGIVNAAIFYAISAAYRLEPAATVNLSGVFFGLGSALAALLISGTFNIYTPSSILFLVAIVPASFAIVYARSSFASETRTRKRTFQDVAREFTIPSAVLFSLLLFFHFGNEWAIAAWLPLFLIERLGLSPAVALLILAAYWLSLMIGRLIAQSLLAKIRHGRLLLGSVVASTFGCVILAFTDNLFGAVSGTLLVGLGFAPIYPLVVEKIGARFPHYHPGFFNGIFSVGLTGGMVAPALLGYASEFAGIQIVMVLPALGSMIVLVLVLFIWIEARFSSPKL